MEGHHHKERPLDGGHEQYAMSRLQQAEKQRAQFLKSRADSQARNAAAKVTAARECRNGKQVLKEGPDQVGVRSSPTAARQHSLREARRRIEELAQEAQSTREDTARLKRGSHGYVSGSGGGSRSGDKADPVSAPSKGNGPISPSSPVEAALGSVWEPWEHLAQSVVGPADRPTESTR